MGLPVHHFSGAGFEEHAVHAQGQAHGVLLVDHGTHGVLGEEEQHGDAQDGHAKAGLDDVGGQGQTQHGAHDGAGRGDEGHGQGQTQVGEVTAQQTGTGSQGTGQGHQQARAADEVQMEGEETRDQRHEEHAAAHTGHDGDDAEDEAEEEQRHRPEPPGMVVHDLGGLHVARGGGYRRRRHGRILGIGHGDDARLGGRSRSGGIGRHADGRTGQDEGQEKQNEPLPGSGFDGTGRRCKCVARHVIPLYCLVGRCPTCIPFDGLTLRARRGGRYQENPEIGSISGPWPEDTVQMTAFIRYFLHKNAPHPRIRPGKPLRRKSGHGEISP